MAAIGAGRGASSIAEVAAMAAEAARRSVEALQASAHKARRGRTDYRPPSREPRSRSASQDKEGSETTRRPSQLQKDLKEMLLGLSQGTKEDDKPLSMTPPADDPTDFSPSHSPPRGASSRLGELIRNRVDTPMTVATPARKSVGSQLPNPFAATREEIQAERKRLRDEAKEHKNVNGAQTRRRSSSAGGSSQLAVTKAQPAVVAAALSAPEVPSVAPAKKARAAPLSIDSLAALVKSSFGEASAPTSSSSSLQDLLAPTRSIPASAPAIGSSSASGKAETKRSREAKKGADRPKDGKSDKSAMETREEKDNGKNVKESREDEENGRNSKEILRTPSDAPSERRAKIALEAKALLEERAAKKAKEAQEAKEAQDALEPKERKTAKPRAAKADKAPVRGSSGLAATSESPEASLLAEVLTESLTAAAAVQKKTIAKPAKNTASAEELAKALQRAEEAEKRLAAAQSARIAEEKRASEAERRLEELRKEFDEFRRASMASLPAEAPVEDRRRRSSKSGMRDSDRPAGDSKGLAPPELVQAALRNVLRGHAITHEESKSRACSAPTVTQEPVRRRRCSKTPDERLVKDPVQIAPKAPAPPPPQQQPAERRLSARGTKRGADAEAEVPKSKKPRAVTAKASTRR